MANDIGVGSGARNNVHNSIHKGIHNGVHNGLLLIDKPRGWSSAYLSRWAGRLLRAKTGHAGTLDPAATGLLVVGVGEGTKVLRYISQVNKTYHARVRVGVRTATDDREGEVLERCAHKPLEADALRRVLQSFAGETEQVPPAYSALKYRGKPLYHYARQGKPVSRPPRRVTMESLELLDVKSDTFSFAVRCSHGTYIRVLARQMGEALGSTAHLDALRRVSVGGFALCEATAPDALRHDNARLLSPDTALQHFPELTLADEEALRLRQGQTIACSQAARVGQQWRVYDADKVFVGVAGVREPGWLKAQRIFHADSAAIDLRFVGASVCYTNAP